MDTAIATLDDIERMANHVVRSGLFGMKTVEQATALMLLCQAKGMHPMEAVEEYHIIQGRHTTKVERMMAKFQAAGGKVQWHQLDDKTADATFSHPAGGSQRLVWTIEMAKVAGLAGRDNWKNYPRAMLRSRLVSEGIKTVFPGAGGLTPEEATDIPAEAVERDVTPPKPATGVAALQERLTALAPAPRAEAEPQVVVDTATGELLPAAGMSFAEVADAINRAGDRDSIIVARDLIRSVADEQQRAELDVLARERANVIRANRKREAAEAEARG